MSNRKRIFSDTDVQNVRDQLAEQRKTILPRKSKTGISQLVKLIKTDIDQLRKDGFTLDQICNMLQSSGVEASHSTLKRYVSTICNDQSAKQKITSKENRKRKSTGVVPAKEPAFPARGAQPPVESSRRRSTIARIPEDRGDL